MSRRVHERLSARVQGVRTRAAIRAWHYRQRHLADGVWFRLRRVLADARAAYLLSDHDARALLMEGFTPQPCGMELAPEKTIVFIDEARLARLSAPRQIPVSLGPEFLSARAVALIPFEEVRKATRQ